MVRKGSKLSEETKAKIRAKRALQIITKEHKENISKAMKGRSNYWLKGKPLSEEHKAKISKNSKRVKMSEENKEKLSKRMKENNPMKNKETREKVSKTLIGKVGPSPNIGRILSEETKAKIRKSWRDPKVLRKRFGRKNRFKNTGIEIKLQNICKKYNIEYEQNKPIRGIPDLFIKPNICIFVDGDFFHGNPIKYKPTDIICTGSKKQEAQKKWVYDASITKALEEKNYIVLRFWETDINKNIEKVTKKILTTISDLE